MRAHCGYCGTKLVAWSLKTCKPGQPVPGNIATKDHINPRSRGGGSHGNIMQCCSQCNQDKGKLTLNEWRLVLSWRYRTLCIFYFERMWLKGLLYQGAYHLAWIGALL